MELIKAREHDIPELEHIIEDEDAQITSKSGYHQPKTSEAMFNSVCDCTHLITSKGSYTDLTIKKNGDKYIYYHQRPLAKITDQHITVRVPSKHDKYKLHSLINDILPPNYNVKHGTGSTFDLYINGEFKTPITTITKNAVKISKAEAAIKQL